MVYIGRVYKNHTFGETGTIEVMLYQKYKGLGLARKFSKKLSELDPSDIKEAVGKGESAISPQTVRCAVVSPLGSEYDTGMFQLPQIGTVGAVLELESKELFNGINYIWLGGVYGNKQYNEKVNLPSDDTKNLVGAESKPLIFDKSNNVNPEDTISNSDYINSGQFIIKTKTCDLKDYNNIDSEKLDYKKIPPENTFVMNKNKLALRHNINGSDYNCIEQLEFEPGGIKIKRDVKVNDGGKTRTVQQSISTDNQGVSINCNNGEKSNTITITLDGDIIVDAGKSVVINANSDSLINVKGNAYIKSDKNMEISSKGKMKIEANGVNLADAIYQLAENVKYLQTFGNPSAHATMPTSQAKIRTTETYLTKGFDKGGVI